MAIEKTSYSVCALCHPENWVNSLGVFMAELPIVYCKTLVLFASC